LLVGFGADLFVVLLHFIIFGLHVVVFFEFYLHLFLQVIDSVLEPCFQVGMFFVQLLTFLLVLGGDLCHGLQVLLGLGMGVLALLGLQLHLLELMVQIRVQFVALGHLAEEVLELILTATQLFLAL